MKQKQSYNAADFMRYRSGAMTPAEMHAIEKAALEDPFLADALEGYSSAAAAENDLAELKKRLAQKVGHSKGRVIAFTPNLFLRIAAMLIIVVGAAYLFYLFNNKSEPVTLADKTVQPIPETTTSTVSADSVSPNTVQPESKQFTDQTASTPSADKVPSAEKAKANGNASEDATPSSLNSAIEQSKPAAPVAAEQSLRRDANTENQQYFLRGKITNAQGGPLQSVTVTNNQNRAATVTKDDGSFILPAADSTSFVTASAPGYKTMDVEVNSADRAVIRLDPVREESVSASAAKKAKIKDLGYSGYEADKKQTTISIISGGASPAKGVAEYGDYLRSHPVKEKGEIVHGEATVAFSVSLTGVPSNIRILTISCIPCAAEILRIVKDGPVWSTTSETVTVRISF